VLATNDIMLTYVQIVKALEYLHSKGWVHGNLSSEHVLICKDGTVKVVPQAATNPPALKSSPFKELITPPPAPPNPLGDEIDYPQYASPEVLGGGAFPTAASDIWSVGVILFEMIFNEKPFEGEEFQTLWKNVSKVAGVPKGSVLQLLVKPTSPIRNPFPAALEIIEETLRYMPSERPTATKLLSQDVAKKYNVIVEKHTAEDKQSDLSPLKPRADIKGQHELSDWIQSLQSTIRKKEEDNRVKTNRVVLTGRVGRRGSLRVLYEEKYGKSVLPVDKLEVVEIEVTKPLAEET